MRASAGARKAVWSAARFSVMLIGSPANIASRRASTPAARAKASSAARLCPVSEVLEKSSSIPAAWAEKRAKRCGSAAKSVRISGASEANVFSSAQSSVM
jgi:hypothetical protein